MARVLPAEDAAIPAASKVTLQAWWTVLVFLLLYIFSTVDRSIIGLLVQPLERDLRISDFQISLLLGPAFGLFYAVCGLPMGWLVDRAPRRFLTLFSVMCWGAATTFCGLATSFVQLAIARMGVGVGEAALTPAAHALIAEQFPARRLASAMSIFTLGSVLGGGIAAAGGGALVQHLARSGPVSLPVIGATQPWQLAFLTIGLATIVVAPVVLSVQERREVGLGAALRRTGSRGHLYFLQNWRIAIALPVAFGCSNIICTGMTVWTPTYLIRTFHWNPAQAGFAMGALMVGGGAVGQIAGAAIVDRMFARGHKDAHVRYHLAGLAITIPALVAGLLAHNPAVFLAAAGLFYCVTYPFVGYAAAALQLHAPDALRGRVSASFLMGITIIGLGLGPPLTALLAQQVFKSKDLLGEALALTAVIAVVTAVPLHLLVARAMRDSEQP